MFDCVCGLSSFFSDTVLSNLLLLDISAIAYVEIRGNESEATRFRAMDASPQLAQRYTRASTTLRSIQVGCHTRSERGGSGAKLAI